MELVLYFQSGRLLVEKIYNYTNNFYGRAKDIDVE